MRHLYLSELISTAISCLFILLFTYAGVSKLIDFQNFRIQLGQSPLLSSFATEVSILVPLIEGFGVNFLRQRESFISYSLSQVNASALTMLMVFTTVRVCNAFTTIFFGIRFY